MTRSALLCIEEEANDSTEERTRRADIKMSSTGAAYSPLPASAVGFEKRRPILRIGFNDYISTVNGLFNFLEIVGGVIVYMVSTNDPREPGAARLLCGVAFAFGFNGIYMMLSSMLSETSAHYLPALFYYVLFQGTGAACYFLTSLSVVRGSHDVPMPAVVGLVTGGFHAFHGAYSYYKLYVEPKEKHWFEKL